MKHPDKPAMKKEMEPKPEMKMDAAMKKKMEEMKKKMDEMMKMMGKMK